jgi:tetratricopeptide (TPR) repeat protein
LLGSSRKNLQDDREAKCIAAMNEGMGSNLQIDLLGIFHECARKTSPACTVMLCHFPGYFLGMIPLERLVRAFASPSLSLEDRGSIARVAARKLLRWAREAPARCADNPMLAEYPLLRSRLRDLASRRSCPGNAPKDSVASARLEHLSWIHGIGDVEADFRKAAVDVSDEHARFLRGFLAFGIAIPACPVKAEGLLGCLVPVEGSPGTSTPDSVHPSGPECEGISSEVSPYLRERFKIGKELGVEIGVPYALLRGQASSLNLAFAVAFYFGSKWGRGAPPWAAFTGTVDVDGRVTGVSGIREKVASAADAGLFVLFAPERDFEMANHEAQEHPGFTVLPVCGQGFERAMDDIEREILARDPEWWELPGDSCRDYLTRAHNLLRHRDRGAIDLARMLERQAQKHDGEQFYDNLLVEALVIQGAVRDHEGDNDAAMTVYDRAVRLNRQLESDGRIDHLTVERDRDLLNRAAMPHLNEFDFETAECLLLEDLARKEEHRCSPEIMASTWGSLGQLYTRWSFLDMSKAEKAFQFLDEALQHIREEEKAREMNYLGDLYLTLGDWAEARQRYMGSGGQNGYDWRRDRFAILGIMRSWFFEGVAGGGDACLDRSLETYALVETSVPNDPFLEGQLEILAGAAMIEKRKGEPLEHLTKGVSILHHRSDARHNDNVFGLRGLVLRARALSDEHSHPDLLSSARSDLEAAWGIVGDAAAPASRVAFFRRIGLSDRLSGPHFESDAPALADALRILPPLI